MSGLQQADAAVSAPLPQWSRDPYAYQKAWIRRKRKRDPVFARRQADAAREWQRANPVRNARNQYRQGARRRGFAWALPDDQFAALVLGECHYCGVPAPADGINGIDRVDNSLGYVASNVVTACAQCNYAKRDQMAAEFVAWARRIVAYQEGHRG
ncbi:MAG: hypothetical protein AB7I50_00495 [Vicinamibacterales bacterium]